VRLGLPPVQSAADLGRDGGDHYSGGARRTDPR
jgi:hypothetical protein